ncbi:MAG: peptidoglycan DD-metalloendopeptidase family protein [Balneolaceae bacterium]
MFSLLLLLYLNPATEQEDPEFVPVSIEHLVEIPPVQAEDDYGFLKGDYEIDSNRIKRNESLYLILRRYDISPRQIDRIQKQASGHANVSRMRPGQEYHIYKKGDEAVAMVWNISRLDYLVINWENDEIDIARDQFEMRVVESSATGTIRHSLYETLQQEGLSQLLGSKIANIFAWEIDFFLLRPGDSFKVIYDELYIGDEFYTVGRVHTAEFQHRGRNRRAYYFEKGEQDGYFDEEGNSLQRALLKAPFKYNQRVSSGFSHNRFHPILKERRPHHGVDYAAPRGTPIIAIGDGVVTEARKRGGNGNIVQIRHNNRYKSAYLHLNGFASGIRSGARVEQGQVIGFVGRTGLATGYHLCYRLYVNDQPVNSLTVELPASESLEEGFMDEFTHKRIEYDRDLAGIADSERGDTFSSVVSVGGRN